MARDIVYISPNKLVIVGCDQSKDSPLNDDRAAWDVDEALVRNIMVYGIQQPVLVRFDAGEAFVVDGRQRVKAAREAAKRQADAGEYEIKVPCIEVQADDNRVVGIMVSTNELRQDDSVLSRARKAAKLLDLTGDEEEVALAFGKHVRTIKNWLKLLQAAPEVHQAIEDGKISANAVMEYLLDKTRDEQVQALDQLLAGMASPAAGGAGGRDTAVNSDAAPDVAAPAATAPAATPRTEGGETVRPGIKKAWLRRALKTTAAKNLEEEQIAVLKWFLEGWCDNGTWMYRFCEDVEAELTRP
jgi:ParB family chromosome partitioning protein